MGRAGLNQTFVVIAAILIAGWWILSGRFDLIHFGTGVVAALAIAANYRRTADGMHMRVGRFFLFVPWLILQIVISNLRVARLVLSPRMVIRPSFISQPPGVRGDRGLTLLGASTTLTPGTLTIDVGGSEIFIHALDARSAADTRDGVVAREVARIFVEPAS
jgi:multicomponent Na+:H+ antiporter subunit E